LSSATIPLIRAAAEGDAEVVRDLLASGADVNACTPKGETTLMRAAFFGHADVVRVLLSAGADVRMKDRSGLTATDWAVRRGFDDIARLLKNPPPADRVLPTKNVQEDKARLAALEELRRRKAEVTKRRAEAAAGKPAEEEAIRKEEHERREAAEAKREADELVRIKAREELQRKVDESRRRVEEETRKKSTEGVRGDVGDGRNTEPAGLASALESTRNKSPEGSGIKRCPKCNTIYKSDILAYCSYDSARLVSEDGPAFTDAAKPHAPETDSTTMIRPWVLVLVALTFLGGGLAGQVINNFFLDATPVAPAPAQIALTNVPQNQPVTDGALKGKEVKLPIPEYPEEARSIGISGEITVAVIVNKKGDVISARPLEGHPLLQAAAVKAAREAKFSSEKLAGGRAKVSGTITYTFR